MDCFLNQKETNRAVANPLLLRKYSETLNLVYIEALKAQQMGFFC